MKNRASLGVLGGRTPKRAHCPEPCVETVLDSRPFPRKRTRFSSPRRSDTSPVGDSWLYRAPREISAISTQPVKLFLSYFVREASFVVARRVNGGSRV